MGRYQFIETDDNIIKSGMAVGTDRAETVTIGLNWYWNRHVRFQLNYSHSWFGDTITVNGVKLDAEDAIISRFQFVF